MQCLEIRSVSLPRNRVKDTISSEAASMMRVEWASGVQNGPGSPGTGPKKYSHLPRADQTATTSCRLGILCLLVRSRPNRLNDYENWISDNRTVFVCVTVAEQAQAGSIRQPGRNP